MDTGLASGRVRGSPFGRDPLAGLVARIREGDRDALRTLYDATSAQAFGLALSILRETQAAEEVVTDVFAQVWRQAARYEPEKGSVTAWVAILARTRAIDRKRVLRRLRDRERELTREPYDACLDPAPGPIESTAASEEGLRVRRALDALPTEQRRALEATFFGGLSHVEAASQLGQPLGTLKTRVRAGLATLRQRLSSSARGEVA